MEEVSIPTKRRKLSGDDCKTVDDKVKERKSEDVLPISASGSKMAETSNVSPSNVPMTEAKEPETSSEVKQVVDSTQAVTGAASDLDEEDDMMSTYQLEKDVGITEYISQHEGFYGILKERYSDFLVNEIDPDGVIVRLTDLSEPVDHSLPPQDPSLAGVISEEVQKQLQELAQSTEKKASVVIEVGDNKEKRTLIHRAIRQMAMGLESKTDEIDNKKVIVVTRMKQKGNRRGDRWPPHRPDYCHFVMYKENRDSMHAVNTLAKFMHMRANHFTFAGTKDKRAKTTQRISVFRVEAERLHKLNNTLHGIKLGNFKFNKQTIKLGDLSGNHFSIILRSVSGSDEQIQMAMTSLKDVGFINYFGMQRFGTSSIPTHHVGRCLLHSKWSEAVELILKARTKDPDVAECLDVWNKTKDPEKAIAKLRKNGCVEMHLLQGLRRFGQTDLVTALQMIPRNTRLMYVHSYQSYAWNCVVSRRIREFGLKPVVGDLVIPGLKNAEVDQNKDELKPMLITEESLSQYTIHDIVLPLPGFSVIYPENSIRDWYKEILAEDNLDIDNLKHKIRDYSLPGTYRKILVKPSDVSWTTFRYDDPHIPLILSDLDNLQMLPEPKTVEGGKLKALKLEFSLPSSTYATMALREVLKLDTSKAHQTSCTLSKR